MYFRAHSHSRHSIIMGDHSIMMVDHLEVLRLRKSKHIQSLSTKWNKKGPSDGFHDKIDNIEHCWIEFNLFLLKLP